MALFGALIVPVGIGCFWLVSLFPALGGCHLHPVLAVGGKDSVESGEIDPRLGYQCYQFRDEVQRLKDDMRGAITVRGFQFIAHMLIGGQCQRLF